jgi:hypothetical protein
LVVVALQLPLAVILFFRQLRQQVAAVAEPQILQPQHLVALAAAVAQTT